MTLPRVASSLATTVTLLLAACAGPTAHQGSGETARGGVPAAGRPGVVSAPPMTDAGWELRAEPGWRWVQAAPLLPAFDVADLAALADALSARMRRAPPLRAITLYLDATEVGRCADDGGEVFAMTAEHRDLITRTGRLVLSASQREWLDETAARLASELEERGLGPQRVRVRTNPWLGVGEVPERSLVGPIVRVYLLLPGDLPAADAWGLPNELLPPSTRPATPARRGP